MNWLLDYLPRGNTLDDEAWGRRHLFLQWVLLLHVPALFVIGLVLGRDLQLIALAVLPTLACLILGHLLTGRRPASVSVTAGLTYAAAGFTALTDGTIQGQFHFFVIIGFIALYQDWIPFLFNIVFTMVLFSALGNGVGSLWQSDAIFTQLSAGMNPWLWSAIHGSAVVAACISMVIFWRFTEEEQNHREALTMRLADAEIGRRRFTSDLLVNLARRNQSMLYRQLDIINQLEEKERDPDALAELFKLDHLATRVRRNAESLLVLSGEQPTRVWRAAVPLRDVVRAAIAETEDLDRVGFAIDEKLAIAGHTVTDLTHLLAELTENAVRFSPPHASVSIRTRPFLQSPGAYLLTVEDWGVGMPTEEMAAANEILVRPPEVDLAVSQRLGFHVVARLGQRHAIRVSLTPTPGCGVTAVVVLPAELFDSGETTASPEAAQPAADNSRDVPLGRDATAPYGFPTPRVASVAPATTAAVATVAPEPVPVPARNEDLRHDLSWEGWWRASVPEQIGSPEQLAGASGTGGNGSGADGHVANGTGAHRLASSAGSPGRRAPDSPGQNAPELGTAGPGTAGPGTAGPGTAGPRTPVPPGASPPGASPRGASPRGASPPGAPSPGASRSASPPAASPPSSGLSGDPVPGPRLNKRVPQSHLAPELRAGVDAEQSPEPAPPPAQALGASEALSRYQASRQAAQAQVHSQEGQAVTNGGASHRSEPGRST